MSLRLTTDRRVIQHLAAFALAWIAAAIIFSYVLRPITIPLPQTGYHIPVLGKGESATRNLLYLAGALRGGQTIVMLGSSELEKRYGGGSDTPDIFFPSRHLAPVLTYGKPGFETLGMYGMLSALRPHLNANTRLVIMLSPSWFTTTDMQAPIFNENFNDSMLLQLYLSDDPRGVIHDYLTVHAADFSNMTAAQRLFMEDPSSIVNWNLPLFIASTINARAYTQREKLDMWLGELDKPDVTTGIGSVHGKDLPWDAFEATARTFEARRMTSNEFWVRDTFYERVVKKNPAKFKTYFPAKINSEPEMDSLKLLLQLLHRSKVKALIVMQPINTRLFQDHDRFEEIDARITNLCREYNMKYMDMYNQPLELGILRDSVHPGNLGWLRVDWQIVEFFNL